MSFREDAAALAKTIQHLYGDLLEEPFFPGAPESGGAPAPQAAVSQSLAQYEEQIRFCQSCSLHIGRHHLVFGRGHPGAKVAFVGDFPSEKDDEKAQPFADSAGELLHKMILAMKLKPEETYLTNFLKCRPPAGQRLEQEHFRQCELHLQHQFRFLKASFIVAMGEPSAKALARSEAPLAVLRKQVFDWNGRSVFCTHHPRELLASPAKKKEAWEDLQAVMRAMGN
jgi:DNA polymerase